MVQSNVAIAASPGTLVPRKDSPAPSVRTISYGPDFLSEDSPSSIEDLKAMRAQSGVLWVDVQGLGETRILEELGELFAIHRLALEDVLNIPQRPKIEDYEQQEFIVVRMPRSAGEHKTEQLSLFFGPGYVLSFQEQPGDLFDPVRERIRQGRPRVRQGGSDYLVYALLDAVVDSYFPWLRELADRLDEIEESLYQNPSSTHGRQLTDIKRDLVSLRRYLAPAPRILEDLTKEDNTLISDATRVYLRDCLDHARQAAELVESYGEIANGLMDLYLSLVSYRMNEVMKVLTIISTIFIPVTFIAGIYGMNFDPSASPWNMPELSWIYGYPIALGAMVLCAAAMLFYFWRKGWFR